MAFAAQPWTPYRIRLTGRLRRFCPPDEFPYIWQTFESSDEHFDDCRVRRAL